MQVLYIVRILFSKVFHSYLFLLLLVFLVLPSFESHFVLKFVTNHQCKVGKELFQLHDLPFYFLVFMWRLQKPELWVALVEWYGSINTMEYFAQMKKKKKMSRQCHVRYFPFLVTLAKFDIYHCDVTSSCITNFS